MPRRLRHFKPDSIFHAGARGVDRQPIFLADSDREFFVTTMQENLRASNIETVSWCLMPNHFHWGMAVSDERFEKALHDTLTAHAVRFNRLHGRTGHLFEGRHWSECCEDVEHVENMIAYHHMNPVRAGIVTDPRQWRWSSYSEWAGGEMRTVGLLKVARLTGRSEESLRQGHADRIAFDLLGAARGLSPDELIDDTASMLGMSATSLRSGPDSERRRRAMLILVRRASKEKVALNALAKSLGCSPEALYMLRRRHPNESA